jgi:hypothetical protein
MDNTYSQPIIPLKMSAISENEPPESGDFLEDKNNNQVIAIPCIHRGERRLSLKFRYDRELIEKLKKIPGCRWSATMRCWHVTFDKETIGKLAKMTNHGGIPLVQGLHDLMHCEPKYGKLDKIPAKY